MPYILDGPFKPTLKSLGTRGHHVDSHLWPVSFNPCECVVEFASPLFLNLSPQLLS